VNETLPLSSGDRDFSKTNSVALESRDLGLEITTPYIYQRLLILCLHFDMCIDSGSTNRAYRMPHMSMINITFGEERRDSVVRRQKQLDSAVAAHQRRTPRPVANGNANQQQQPLYRVLQHPRNLESSPAGQQMTRSSQDSTVSLQLHAFNF